jgi:threonine dehydrogenase-like Zn-dependent dehydrogenase
MPGILSGYAAPLRLVTIDPPKVDRPGWARLRSRLSGICGSDLGALSGKTSLYFSAVVSLPFVPGHEVVGELLDDCGDLDAGQRVVLSSVLACAARGEDPVCRNCAAGDFGRCDRVTIGDLKPGLQTGYCTDTGGGWSRLMTAHRSQLFAVPDGMGDRSAVLVEPMAAAVHAALRAQVPDGGSVLIVGAGTVGILTALAIQRLAKPGRMIVAAKHPRQREAARLVGATEVVRPEHTVKAVRRGEHAVKLTPERGQEFLLGGVDVAIECVGSTSALDLALRTTRAGGRVVLSGIPAGGADLTPLWFRELELVGAYTGGTEDVGGKRRRTFDLAMEIAGDTPMLDDLVGATYPLARWREALDHALGAGALGTFKVAFAPQET